MKKAGNLLVLLLYLIPAIGVTVSAHYCGGKISSISFNPFDTTHTCPCGSKQMKQDCCKDKTTTIKLDDEQQKTQKLYSNNIKIADLQQALSINLTYNYHSPILLVEFDHSSNPPDDIKHPLYIRHCVYRI